MFYPTVPRQVFIEAKKEKPSLLEQPWTGMERLSHNCLLLTHKDFSASMMREDQELL